MFTINEIIIKDKIHTVKLRGDSSIVLLLVELLTTTVCQRLATVRWFSLDLPVYSIKKTDRHDITEILLKVAINTIIQTKQLRQGVLGTTLCDKAFP